VRSAGGESIAFAVTITISGEQGDDVNSTGAYTYDVPRGRSRRERVARLEKLAVLMDTALVIPGTNIRFGLDALIGLFPAIGDTITTVISLYIVHEAHQLGAPQHLILRMLGNVAVDGLVGAVPVVGDAFDVVWRSNIRNMRLLREWMEREGLI